MTHISKEQTVQDILTLVDDTLQVGVFLSRHVQSSPYCILLGAAFLKDFT